MTEVSQDRMESALEFLAETDRDFALEKAELERSEIARKRARSKVFLTSDGTVAERQAKAEMAQDVIDADDRYVKTIEMYETLKARRERAEIVIDVWRSINANRRKV
jgi:hypothetical protein